MPLAPQQIRKLKSRLSQRHVRTREVEGRTIAYLEGWHVIAEANRIFGFDGWDRELVDSSCVYTKQQGERFNAAYVARIRIKVRAGEHWVTREGSGAGESSAPTPGQAHELALKAAETDATKRAFMTFGNPFGLSLYGPAREEPSRQGAPASPVDKPNGATQPARTFSGRAAPTHAPFALDPEDEGQTEPVADRPCDRLGAVFGSSSGIAPRNAPGISGDPSEEVEAPGGVVPEIAQIEPSVENPAAGEAYALRSNALSDITQATSGEHREGEAAVASIEPAEPGSIRPSVLEPTAAPRAPTEPSSSDHATSEPALPEPAAPPLAPPERVKIDKSVLALNEPTRIRDAAHLKFVAGKPCLICGRNRAQAHHLRFAQPKAMGRKVSDEYTVPLCSLHHRLLDQTGNEIAWWECQKIDPMVVAAEL